MVSLFRVSQPINCYLGPLQLQEFLMVPGNRLL